MTQPLLVILFLYSITTFAQKPIKLTQLDTTQLPAGITWEGKIKNAVRWTDKQGDNIVLTTETGIYQNKKFKHENEGSDAELFAYHYIIQQATAQLTWKVYDFIKDCPVDIETTYLKNSFQVTDLNNDGVGEVWLMYKTVCHGDVSPSDMKIIMYQGQQKFAMRGKNKVQISEKEYEGGNYTFDKAFEAAHPLFKDFAKKLWNKNILQKWEE